MTDRRAACMLLLALAALPAAAHELISTKLTWTDNVAPIFHRRCVSCHREGGAAPMPLLTYEQTRPWAKAIKVQILSRAMPPWGPVKGYGEFRDDPSLSQEEIAVISSWVEGGAPQGEPVPPDARTALQEAPALTIPAADELPIEDQGILRTPTRVLGVKASGAVEMRAELPNGSVIPLVWIPRPQPLHAGVYWYREALALPAGTELRVFADQGGTVSLLIEPR